MNPPSKTFGEILKELRKKTGKSQTEVAEEIAQMFPGEMRISQTTLSLLEQRSDPPRKDIIEMLAQYYEVPIGYFTNPDMTTPKGVEIAKNYLEELRNMNFQDNRKFARSEGLRSKDDGISKSLENLTDEDDEHFDF